ncbi:MAG: helicase-related protein [Gemmatimonadales bacterium]
MKRPSPAPFDASTRLCAETLAGIADPLFPALASAQVRSPETVARATLAGLLEPLESALPAEPLPEWLLPHQADAVLRARGILARFGGVLVADGVGLGKTYIGLALAALERSHGGGAVAFVPAATVPEWRDAAAAVAVPLAVHSHTALARRMPALPDRCTLVLVDEAHAFRNPRTLRYDALARLVAGRRVALLSATPLNNTPADLEALVHLFASRDRFREHGIADLSRALREASPSAALALGAISVCRTRRLVEERFPELRGAFPRRILRPPITYDLAACYGGDLPPLLREISRMAEEVDAGPAAALLRVGLLRRLESSRPAFRRSLARQRDVLDEIARASEQGVAISRGDVRAAWSAGAEESQLALWPLLAPQVAAPGWDRLASLRDATDRALALIDAASAAPDTKVEALQRLLEGPLTGIKTIVFTEYRDTALYLLRRLRRAHRVICVVGNVAHAGASVLSRREALDAFAPRSRGRPRNPLLDADVLIATDVLSEGLNLQDAQAVVCYDLPWNPVRVMQRIGRVERLGSQHRSVEVAHVVPAAGLEDLTSVLRVLRDKLNATGATIGAEPDPLASLWWVDAGAPRLVDLEQEGWRRVAPFEARERWRAVVGSAVASRSAPLLAAAIADDELPPAVGILLALEWRGGIRVPLPFVLEAGRPPRLDGHALGTLATRALRGRPTPCDPALFTGVLSAVLPEARTRMLSLSAARRGTADPGPGRMAALELLGRAAAIAHRARADDTSLSAGIDLLARDLPAGLDRMMGRLARECGLPQELARRIHEVLSTSLPPAAPALNGTPRLVLVAAIALATRCPSA